MRSLFKYERVPLDVITVGDRRRKDLGDLEKFAENLKQYGQLQPIGLTEELTLVFGERRLRAVELLGWKDIWARVGPYDDLDALEVEIVENTERKEFTPTEMAAISAAVKEKEKAAARDRMGNPDDFRDEQKGPVRDRIAKTLGVSGKHLEKIEAVVAAAEEDPDEYQGLVNDLEAGGSVTSAYNKLKRAQDEKRVLSVRPIEGKFKTLIIDPPWKMDWLSESAQAALKYKTMTLDEIAAIDPKQWADDEFCHVYMWAPNVFVGEAWRIMTREWGIDYRCLLTWNKPSLGQGSYFRHDTEQVLFGTCGKTKKSTRVNHLTTSFPGPPHSSDHSSKPDELYARVMEASYPPYGELFGRVDREDITQIFQDQAG